MTTVQRGRLITAPADRVWAVVRDFAGLHAWVPTTPGPAEIVGDPAVPGAERVFRRDGEIAAVERLVTLDDARRVTAYTIVRAAARFDDHLATVTVSDQGTDTLVEWEATFTTDPAIADHIAGAMGDATFGPGLERLAELVESGR